MRRSLLRPNETRRHLLLSPYRCVSCSERFWVVSRKAKATAALSGTLLAFVAAGFVAARSWPEAGDAEVHAIAPAPAHDPPGASPSEAGAAAATRREKAGNDPSS